MRWNDSNELFWGAWRRKKKRQILKIRLAPVPVLLDIFFDAALGFDEGEGRLAIAFRRHGNALLTTQYADLSFRRERAV